MPIIPRAYIATASLAIKQAALDRREKLGLSDDTVVVLFFGRLSVHAKAAPFQLAQAVQAASALSKRSFAIVWCGWFNNGFQRKVFMQTAKSMAPSVPFHHVDGRDPDARFSIWSAADIFCSLSDNIQESFGLTVIEAMAVSFLSSCPTGAVTVWRLNMNETG